MVFKYRHEFKATLDDYCILKRFDIVYAKNETLRVRASCKAEGCPFLIYASIDGDDDLFKIKTFKENHNCNVVYKNGRASYAYLGKRFMKKLKILPNLKLEEMHIIAREEFDVDVSRGTISRARGWALKLIHGNVEAEFNRLHDYIYALRQADPKGNIELMVERGAPNVPFNFRRFYVGFSGLRKGFMEWCRPILFLDGCFLKGKWKGELLVAIGGDGNEKIYPVAWAVVEKENRASWGWFLTNLQDDLNIGDGAGFTLMTDQQKGLKEEIKVLLHRVEHRVCARHLFGNWMAKHSGGDLQKLFWSIVKPTTEPRCKSLCSNVYA